MIPVQSFLFFSMMATREEIASLIYLLEDPDEFVRESVMNRFEQLGEGSVPLLDEFRVGVKDTEQRKFLDELLVKITIPALEQDFLNFVEGGIANYTELEQGVLMLARIDNPTIREELYSRKLDRMAAEIEGPVNYTLLPMDQIKILLKHVYERHGMQAATDSYFEPENAHLHRVLEENKGIPLTLAMVSLFLARRLDLPLTGINMPVHFMMRYDFDGQVVFLDPFSSGKVVTMNECMNFLKRNTIRPEQEYFNPAHPAVILLRAMRNLHNSYTRIGDTVRASGMELLITHMELLFSGRGSG
jgi:regulator of sirC expression with transglutaminase-like and TPR domain